MKNLKLESYGVLNFQELNHSQMLTTNGGEILVNPKHLRYKGSMAEALYNFFCDFADGFTSQEVNRGYRQVTGKSL